MPRVLIVRGHLVTPWELRPWMELPERFEVRCLLTGSNRFDAPGELRYARVGALRDRLPRGFVGEALVAVLGDRYLDAAEAFAWADIVHAEELSFWFAAEAARWRQRHGFRLVQTVWETLPLLNAFRNRQARQNRALVLSETDLFLPTTERAALALALEGVTEDRISVCPPGIDTERFAAPANMRSPDEHVIVSPGRLVWEKGHQDVLRAATLLHRGIVAPAAGPVRPRVQIIGSGPEEARLRAHAQELGIGSSVTIGGVPYDEMPARFATASAMVLATQGAATAAYHPFGIPRAFWEEQFGLVLAEAMAASLDVIATTSGAVPEVLADTDRRLVAPGDWVGLAHALAQGPLSRPPGERVGYPSALIERYSVPAAAKRLAAVYDRVSS